LSGGTGEPAAWRSPLLVGSARLGCIPFGALCGEAARSGHSDAGDGGYMVETQ
jgi:hypothetical protein